MWSKSLFLLACLACVAFSNVASIVSTSTAASSINLCLAQSVLSGTCIPKNIKSEEAISFDPDDAWSFDVWQLFTPPKDMFPYKITSIYFMLAAYLDSEECGDGNSDCFVDIEVYTATAKAEEYAKAAEACPKYTLTPNTPGTLVTTFEQVVPPAISSGAGLTDKFIKLTFTNPIVITSPQTFIGLKVKSNDDSAQDGFYSFSVYGSQKNSAYCNPYSMNGVVSNTKVNPFEAIMIDAEIEAFTPTDVNQIPGWTGTLAEYTDNVCHCGKGAADPACFKNPVTSGCSSDSVCWDGACKKIDWNPSPNPVYGQEYKACDPHHYGSDGICDLGCGSGRGSLDPDCFVGRNYNVSFPGASRDCDRSQNTCGEDKWKCSLNEFNDGTKCHCNCGVQDPDCDNANLPTTCEGTVMCEDAKCTVPREWTCAKELYNDGSKCNCECGIVDPDCYQEGRPSDCGYGKHCSSAAHCIVDVCGDGEVNPSQGQQCDSGKHCLDTCMCETNFEATFPPSRDCVGICGDGFVVDGEECDSSGGCLSNCTCDSKFVAKNGTCVGCGNGVVDPGEQCDGGENCVLQTCKCKSGYQRDPGTNGCSKKSNIVVVVVVSVAVAVIVIAAACVIVFVVIPSVQRRKDAGSIEEETDGVQLDEAGNGADKVKADGPGGVSPLNTMCTLTAGSPKLTAAPFVGQRNYIKETWSVSPEETDFNTSGLEVEVGATQQQMFELKNLAPSQMQFSVNVPRSNKFLITAFPEKGTVKSGFSMSFRVQITLYCNVAIDQVPFAVSVQFDGEEKNQQYTLVPMTIRAQRSNRIDYDDLVFEETVGEGSFGSVWRGKYQGQVVAIKTLRTITESALKDFLREIEMLAQFNNPYIMGYFGSVITNDKLCMVIEYLSMGSLSALLKQYHLSPRLKTRLALDSVKGLAYLHTLNIMHRDIKPGNVLVSSFDPSMATAICKIADFGTSRVLNGSAEDQAALQKGLGTPLYMAPEILGSNKTYTQSADVYSFGIMLAHIWNEESPYKDLHFDTPWALANYVSSGNRPQIDEGCPQAYYQLMTQCWQADPAQRPSFQQCVEFLEQLNNLFAEQPEEPDFVHFSQKLE